MQKRNWQWQQQYIYIFIEFQEYAEPAINKLLEHFGEEKRAGGQTFAPVICASDARRDAIPMMTALRGYTGVGPRGLTFKQGCKRLIDELGEIYPDWAKLAKIACTIPVSSVPAERGFSLQNRIKTAIRSRLLEERVTRLMRISSSKKDVTNFNFAKAAEHFRAAKSRRK